MSVIFANPRLSLCNRTKSGLYVFQRGLGGGPLAANFVRTSSQSLTIVDNASLSGGDIDMWGACWFYMESAVEGALMAKYGAAGSREYSFYYNTSSPAIIASSDGTAITSRTYAATAINTWWFAMWYHDAVNNLLAITRNNAAFLTTAFAGGIFDSAAEFAVGSFGGANYMNGLIDSACIGKSPVGGIAGLATTIRDSLYNSGNGKKYSDLTASEKTDWGLISFWDLDGVNDAHGSNHLTNNNGVTFVAGKV